MVCLLCAAGARETPEEVPEEQEGTPADPAHLPEPPAQSSSHRQSQTSSLPFPGPALSASNASGQRLQESDPALTSTSGLLTGPFWSRFESLQLPHDCTDQPLCTDTDTENLSVSSRAPSATYSAVSIASGSDIEREQPCLITTPTRPSMDITRSRSPMLAHQPSARSDLTTTSGTYPVSTHDAQAFVSTSPLLCAVRAIQLCLNRPQLHSL